MKMENIFDSEDIARRRRSDFGVRILSDRANKDRNEFPNGVNSFILVSTYFLEPVELTLK